MANKKSFFHIALRRSTAIVIDLAVILIGLCHYASNACLRHALSLSGAVSEDWFELSRLFGFGESAGLVMVVSMLVRHVVDFYRARRSYDPEPDVFRLCGKSMQCKGRSETRREEHRFS